jgi:uncharacterized protein (TIGR02147 family)
VSPQLLTLSHDKGTSGLVNYPLNYKDQLKSELARRKIINPSYSLRAFAKKLDLSPAYLSKVFNDERTLSVKAAGEIAQKLGYSEGESLDFCKLVAGQRIPTVLEEKSSLDSVLLSLDRFELIADWYHYALLVLTECKDFKAEPSWIADQLSITKKSAADAINRLLRLGLIKKAQGRFKKVDKTIATPTDQVSRALRSFHSQMIAKAGEAIEQQDIQDREISGITLAIGPEQLVLAKKEIKKFQMKMARLLKTQEASEVYQLNVQFFRLSKKKGAL